MAQDSFNTFWGLTSDIKRIAYAGGLATDDARLSERQIFWWISNYYATFIRQDFERNPDTINPDFYLKYCFDLCECPRTDCPECSLDPCCTIYKGEIPTVMNLQGYQLISFVGSADNLVSWSRVSHMGSVRPYRSMRGNGNKIFYRIHGGVIYVDAPKEFDLECGVMYAIPQEMAKLPENCALTGETTIRQDYVARIRQAILTTELQFSLQTIADIQNNTSPK